MTDMFGKHRSTYDLPDSSICTDWFVYTGRKTYRIPDSDFQEHRYVISIKDYITRESTLLSFRRGDVIRIIDPEMKIEEGEFENKFSIS